MKYRIISGAAALCALFPAIAFAGEENTVNMKDVPPAAKAAAMAAAPGVKFDKVGLDMDDGTASYEFAGKMDGKAIELDVMEDGTVEEMEHEISMDEVPERVSKTLKKHMGDFEPKFIEKSVRNGFQVYYEFEGEGPEGGELDVEISADGKKIIIQDDTAA